MDIDEIGARVGEAPVEQGIDLAPVADIAEIVQTEIIGIVGADRDEAMAHDLRDHIDLREAGAAFGVDPDRARRPIDPLRAAEMGCDALLKATKVDGVYDADPHRVANAKRFERLSYHDVLARDLQVMDQAAISLARENRIPILVFSIFENGGFAEVVQGKGRFTIVDDAA